MSKQLPSVLSLPTPIKSANDQKEYKCIKLPNGLTVLLISDTSYDLSKLDKEENDEDTENKHASSGLKLSAASLCVGVGAFSDPLELPGLAHFLEHMLFMGSKKYPTENEYKKFIKDHGGYANAWTYHELTSFHFEIQRKHFKEGLDMFAQFFIAPLMLKSAMEREREAVDSENQMRIPKDFLRTIMVYESVANKNHPYR